MKDIKPDNIHQTAILAGIWKLLLQPNIDVQNDSPTQLSIIQVHLLYHIRHKQQQ